MNAPRHSDPAIDGVAIVGMACRFPGAENVDQFWRNIRDGVESITFFSDQELLSAGVPLTLLSDPTYVKAGAVLQDIRSFDAAFFGYSPREAEMMDPQQRLFLECAWTALETAGYGSDVHDCEIGVYAGSRVNSYLLNNLLGDVERFNFRNRVRPLAFGDDDFLTTRVSHKLNLRGPSLKVQTACSTSLVAIHLACQALLNGECDMAVAGGVALRIPEKVGYLYEPGNVVSPDGHCRSFDQRAQGTVFGSGVGAVVLKRWVDAIADGDNIDAIVRGSAINNDGASKVGFSAPSVEGQARAIAEAIEVAGILPETIAYIEAHGTATQLGDMVELAALTQVFCSDNPGSRRCAIGSVKSNIGHASAAAGVAGLIKTVLALKHKLLPPSLHFEKPNPSIDFDKTPFFVNTSLSEWKTQGVPRRAGVSSFGIGGTNAHAVLEEPPESEASAPSRKAQVLVLSAKTRAALDVATTNLAEHLKRHPDVNIADAAFTLQVGRKAFNHRRALVCNTLGDASAALAGHNSRRILTSNGELTDGSTAFIFPGQGSQYINMGRQLYDSESVFRSAVDVCAELLRPNIHHDLRDALYPDHPQQRDKAARLLDRTQLAQPALFTIEYAMAKLLISWGIQPTAMIGHSVGEYVAACLAQVFSLEDGLTLIATRGRMMDNLPTGAMLAIGLGLEQVSAFLSDGIALAAHNSPNLCVLSGEENRIQEIEKSLRESNVNYRRLHTSHAFHSAMMEPALQGFAAAVKKVRLKAPTIPYLSNVSGTWITESEATDAGYWTRQLRSTVRFSEGLTELLRTFKGVLLEVGPGGSLSTAARQHQVTCAIALPTMRYARQNYSDDAFLTETLGRLWTSGVTPNWKSCYSNENRRRIPLPTYPFERQCFWVDPQPQSQNDHLQAIKTNSDVSDWFYLPSWKRSSLPQLSESQDHPAQPGASWLVFSDTQSICLRLLKALEVRGDSVIRVECGEAFLRHDHSRYTINPRRNGDYVELLRKIDQTGSVPARIVHCWSIAPSSGSPGIESFDAAQPLGFYSLLYLAQAFEKLGVVTPWQIDFISSQLQEIGEDGEIQPQKVTALGPCKVLPQEYANISVRVIDIVPAKVDRDDEGVLAEQLLKELLAETGHSMIAYRGKYRWVQTFEPVKVTANCGSPRLRHGGVYLITGGLGHIGTLIAYDLARAFKATLILTARTALPAKDDWREHLQTHADNDAVSRRIRKLIAMEELGATVLTIGADAGSMEQMRGALAQAERQVGPLNGVIHAAGILGEKLMIPAQEACPEECEPQFHAKAHGLIVLDELLRGKELDFRIAISSISSVLGGLGYSTYAAANLFMDAFAQHAAQRGREPWMSVNFGRWELAEGEKERSPFAATADREAMRFDDGLEAFHRILRIEPVPQIVVSNRELESRVAQWKPRRFHGTNDTSPVRSRSAAATPPLYSRPNLPYESVAPRTEDERLIARIWEDLLGIRDVGIHDSFLDLGGDSLLATRALARLRETFLLELSLRTIFDAKTIAELAAIVGQAQQKKNKELKLVIGELEILSDESDG